MTDVHFFKYVPLRSPWSMAVQYRKYKNAVSQFRSFAVSQFRSFAVSLSLAAAALCAPFSSQATTTEPELIRCDNCTFEQMQGKALTQAPRLGIGHYQYIVFDSTTGHAQGFDVFSEYDGETGISYKDSDIIALTSDQLEAFQLYKELLNKHNTKPPLVIEAPKPTDPNAPMPEMMIPVPANLNGISTGSVRDVMRDLSAMHAVSNYIRDIKTPSGYLQIREGIKAFLKKIMKEAPIQETVVFIDGSTLGFVLINPFGSEPYAVIEGSAVTKDSTAIPGGYDTGGFSLWTIEQRDGAVLRWNCKTFYTRTAGGDYVPQEVCWYTLRP